LILSHRHKFIFLKTHKTAGTSVEIALSQFCGPRDIIAPITSNDEATRKRLGYRGRQNFRAPINDYSKADFTKLFTGRGAKRRFYNHMTAAEVKALVDDEVWNTYYKFCFERTPWDKVVSHYYWAIKNKPNPLTLKEFIHSDALWRSKSRGHGIYSLNGQVVADQVCCFELLGDELAGVLSKLGIGETPDLPRAKSGHRQDKRHYRELLDDEDRKRIADVFAEEIDMLGYTF